MYRAVYQEFIQGTEKRAAPDYIMEILVCPAPTLWLIRFLIGVLAYILMRIILNYQEVDFSVADIVSRGTLYVIENSMSFTSHRAYKVINLDSIYRMSRVLLCGVG